MDRGFSVSLNTIFNMERKWRDEYHFILHEMNLFNNGEIGMKTLTLPSLSLTSLAPLDISIHNTFVPPLSL